ncbi:hypothetical protein QQP08_006679 [Theobroma cacao]|nr:hypothetical protein QQP08_006679 [Theobroma cacao]
MKPPLLENSIGRKIVHQICRAWLKKLKNGIKEFSENYVMKLHGSDGISIILKATKEVGNLSKRDDIDFYNNLSWCRFDLYKVDFGWGKPIWVSIAGAAALNIYSLLDTRDGKGIEAWVGLSEAIMGFFEWNEEPLEFAFIIPSA